MTLLKFEIKLTQKIVRKMRVGCQWFRQIELGVSAVLDLP